MLSPSCQATVWNFAVYGWTSEAIKLIFIVQPSLYAIELMRAEELIENWYEAEICTFRWLDILEHLKQK